MCTMIVEKAAVSGSGKGPEGWFELREVNVSYDHPFHVQREHALNIDFVNESMGASARVSVELTPESATQLMETIRAALQRGSEATGDF